MFTRRETIEKRLSELSPGHVSTLWGLIVWRIGNSYHVGENKISCDTAKALTKQEAVSKIYGIEVTRHAVES